MGYFRNLYNAAVMPPIKAISSMVRPSAAYEGGASFVRRARHRSSQSTQGPNALLSAHGYELIRRARGLVRNNPWASNALDSYTSNAIGTGITPMMSKHPNVSTREKVLEAWLSWTDQADAAGISDYYGQQTLEVREVLEAGECFVRLRPRNFDDGLLVPLQRQLLEAEHVPFWLHRDLENGNRIRNGIEFNRIGRRLAYHMYREHPGEHGSIVSESDLVRVPARWVQHLYNPIRAGQHRGQTWLTQVILRLEELDQYEDAELVRKKFAAMITHFITEVNPAGEPIIGDGEDKDDDGITDIQEIEPGSSIKLKPGESVETSQAAEVGGMYSEFMMWNLYAVAAGLGITFEQLTGNLKGVTYSSIRQGALEFRRRCERFQHQVVVFQDCRPTWKAWCEQAALVGIIDAGEYNAHPEWYAVEWQPPKWPWIDPSKDVKAEIDSVRAGFKSQTEVITGLGNDPARVRQQTIDDNEANDAAGLKPECDPRNARGAAAQAQPKPPNEEEDEEQQPPKPGQNDRTQREVIQ